MQRSLTVSNDTEVRRSGPAERVEAVPRTTSLAHASSRRTLRSRNRLHVDAVLTDAGDPVFEGQDLNGSLGHRSRWETVPAAMVPRVVAALGGAPGDDVLALLADHGDEVVLRGESTWLRSLGIDHTIDTHSSD